MKVSIWILAAALIAGIVLGVWWLVWSLWCYVLPQLWASGPTAFVRPSYWLFVAMWVLFGVVGRLIFGGSKSKEE